MRIDLTERQWDRLSGIVGNLAIIPLTSIVIPFIFESQNMNLLVLISGLALSLGCIIVSISIADRR